MTPASRKVFVALLALGAFAVGAWVVRGSTSPAPAKVDYPTQPVPAARPAEELKKLPVGMSGCLAAACHGGPAEKALAGQIDGHTWQSSGTCWAAADPHGVAYSLLTDAPLRPVRVTAAQIMASYAKEAPGKKATEDARCVACHTNPALARPELMADPHSRQLRAEGVSCEACHGNAGKWVSEHTAWRGPRDKVYEEGGMVRLYDLGERAANCAGCHVGAPADPARGLPVRDMNHDMIAAGHPRLNFDFAEYVRRLPKHWQEKDRTTEPNSPRTVNPLKEWYVGRVAHAEAACKLLADRAGRSMHGDKASPWPEFAEFNCAACHHHLSVDDKKAPHANWRRTADYLGDRPPGSIPWQMIWPVTNAPGIAKPTRRDSPVWPVLEVMEKPRPARAGAAKPVAAKTAAGLHAMRLSLTAMPDAEVAAKARAFLPAGAPLSPEWDTATQLFFGYAALERAEQPGKAAPPAYAEAVAAFRKQNRDPNQMPNWQAVEEALKAIRPRK
jgi:hypothetical protein